MGKMLFFVEILDIIHKKLNLSAKKVQKPLEKRAELVYNKMNCIIRPNFLTVNIGGQTKW